MKRDDEGQKGVKRKVIEEENMKVKEPRVEGRGERREKADEDKTVRSNRQERNDSNKQGAQNAQTTVKNHLSRKGDPS